MILKENKTVDDIITYAKLPSRQIVKVTFLSDGSNKKQTQFCELKKTLGSFRVIYL